MRNGQTLSCSHLRQKVGWVNPPSGEGGYKWLGTPESNRGSHMSAKSAAEYRYNRLTWPEMNDAIAAQKLVILPTASTEQHGKHLPIDVDTFLCESVCLEVGRRTADQVLVLPPIAYGLNLHHIDFPGTIHIAPETFIAFGLNITK